MFDTLFQLHKINFFKMWPKDRSVAGHSKRFVTSIFPRLYDVNYFFFPLNYHFFILFLKILFFQTHQLSQMPQISPILFYSFKKVAVAYLLQTDIKIVWLPMLNLSKILIKYLPGNAWPCWRNCGGNFFDSSPRRIWTPSLWNSELGSELGSFTDFVFSPLLFLAPSL